MNPNEIEWDKDAALVDPVCIDTKEVARFPWSEYRQWYTNIRQNAEKNVFARLYRCYLELKEHNKVSQRIEGYFQQLLMVDYLKFALDIPVLEIVFAFSNHSGISCHEFFFGERQPVVLSGKTAAFVRSMEEASEAWREKILSRLIANRIIADNPCFFVKFRAYEAAYVCGRPASSVRTLATEYPHLDSMFQDIYSNYIPPMVADMTEGTLTNGHGDFHFVLRLCTVLDQPADFFLAQDYTHLALLDGERLTVDQQQWLHAYLCASCHAQDVAISQVVLSKFDKLPT